MKNQNTVDKEKAPSEKETDNTTTTKTPPVKKIRIGFYEGSCRLQDQARRNLDDNDKGPGPGLA
jgi:hypothetical protein